MKSILLNVQKRYNPMNTWMVVRQPFWPQHFAFIESLSLSDLDYEKKKEDDFNILSSALLL